MAFSSLLGGSILKVMCGTLFTPKEQLKGVSIIVEDGKIKDIVPSTALPDESDCVDASSYWVVPGFIDPHTHIGIYRLEGESGDHGFEASDTLTPQLNVVDGLDPFDPAFDDALQSGVTTVGILPGSYMSFGSSVEKITIMPGQGAIYKTNRRLIRRSAFIKCALGEHPKRFLSERKMVPTTRMGIMAEIRSILLQAQRYMKNPNEKINPKLEAIIPVLKKEIPLRVHAHTLRDILAAKKLAEEFDIRIILDHATEAHLIKEELRDIPIVYGPIVFSRRGVELKNLDSSNLSQVKGLDFCLTTDHPTIPIQYLDLLAGLSLSEGFSLQEALSLITINAARILGIGDQTGSIEIGKDADLVVLSNRPFEPDTKVICTIVDGQVQWRSQV